jgi:hypothetical protein
MAILLSSAPLFVRVLEDNSAPIHFSHVLGRWNLWVNSSKVHGSFVLWSVCLSEAGLGVRSGTECRFCIAEGYLQENPNPHL